MAQALAAYAVENLEEDKENSEDDEDKGSDKDYEVSDEDIDDEDYKPGVKTRKEVKGARKRKQGFKLRIRQSARKTVQAAQVDNEKHNVPNEEESEKEERINKPKRTKKRRHRIEKRVATFPSKKRRQNDELVKYATNVHCFICKDEDIKYPTEDDFFVHIVKEHLDQSSPDKVVLPCGKCNKSFRVSGVKGSKSSHMRTPVYTLLNHLVDKHGIMRPDWAPIYK